MKNFVLIGAGFVAPRHAAAIKAAGGNLVAFTDPYDAVGWMDRYFPEARYFKRFEQFDLFVNETKKNIDYTCICSPNYLHYTHIHWALRHNTDVICEKPIVLYCSQLQKLRQLEIKSKHRMWAISQLRLHPSITLLKITKQNESSKQHPALVDIDYNVHRGPWYNRTWKANKKKSGGLATNIGIHMFDLLTSLFGKMSSKIPVPIKTTKQNHIAGTLKLERANVNWNLSIDNSNPIARKFIIDGHAMDLSKKSANLHAESYKKILNNQGFTIDDVAESIKICEIIRNL